MENIKRLIQSGTDWWPLAYQLSKSVGYERQFLESLMTNELVIHAKAFHWLGYKHAGHISDCHIKGKMIDVYWLWKDFSPNRALHFAVNENVIDELFDFIHYWANIVESFGDPNSSKYIFAMIQRAETSIQRVKVQLFSEIEKMDILNTKWTDLPQLKI